MGLFFRDEQTSFVKCNADELLAAEKETAESKGGDDWGYVYRSFAQLRFSGSGRMLVSGD